MSARRQLAGLVAAVACSAGWLAAASAAERDWQFDVYLDGREIGAHRFELSRVGDALRLETEARFSVRILFFTAFDYRHRNVEWWRDGCLERVEARTTSNGRDFRVAGERRDAGFVLETGDGTQRLDECVGSFAYWDPRLLRRQRLLNTQTGEYQPVALQRLPSAELQLGDRDVTVERYLLTGPGLRIELAYAADTGEWLALDSIVDGGRQLEYRRAPGDLL